ncbi:ecto-ADP-ribosyltransferase 5-like [Pseudophryne corroboree]|uniref:ecto-ADP-ribosyltransferase 5-like n=1 Tax=Pseudophryne corroboree TaxID=495146 RepID=UPI003081C2A0
MAGVDAQWGQLGMFEYSFDDQYVGCLNQMEALVPDLLRKERQNDKALDNAWKNASETWLIKKSSMKTLPEGFKDEHGIALLVHVNNETKLKHAVVQYEMDPQSFMYHSFHFYLTRALTLLRAGCDGKPLTTYMGTNIISYPPLGSLHHVRLEHFLSTTADLSLAQTFANGSFFNITTCFGVEVHNFSIRPFEKEVVIPVNEVFHVSENIKEGNIFILQSSKKRCSYYNCAYLGGKLLSNEV